MKMRVPKIRPTDMHCSEIRLRVRNRECSEETYCRNAEAGIVRNKVPKQEPSHHSQDEVDHSPQLSAGRLHCGQQETKALYLYTQSPDEVMYSGPSK